MNVEITSDDEERGFNSNDVDDLVRQMRYISRRLAVTVERIEIAIRNERNPRPSLPAGCEPPTLGERLTQAIDDAIEADRASAGDREGTTR